MSDVQDTVQGPVRITLWAIALLLILVSPSVGTLGAMILVAAVLVFDDEARKTVGTLIFGSVLQSILTGIILGLAIRIAFTEIYVPISAVTLGEIPDLSAFSAVEGNWEAYLSLLMIGIFVGGIGEEVVYRGFVIGWGTRLFGTGTGWLLALVSAVTFGAAHLYQGLSGAIGTGLIGFALGAAYLMTGRKLLPVVTAHITINAIGITEIYLGRELLDLF